MANIPGPDGKPFPQLGSVALQSGIWAAENILADVAGKPRRDFHYHDKGIMAMIGRGAAVAEVGAHRHELHGSIAFAAWLGVHAALMSGVRNRIEAFIDWGWDYFSKTAARWSSTRARAPHGSTGARTRARRSPPAHRRSRALWLASWPFALSPTMSEIISVNVGLVRRISDEPTKP